MLINKNGKIVANASQATVIFETKTEYNTWIDAFPAVTPQSGETAREAKERVYLPRFVVIKKYETAEENGMVIYKDDLAAIKATGSDTKEKAIYVDSSTLKLYKTTAPVSPATEATVQELSAGGAGGVEVVTAFPAVSAAEAGIIYVLESTGEAKTLNIAGDALIAVADDIVVSTGFDPTTPGFVATAGQIVIDTTAKKAWVCTVAGTSTTAGTYIQFLGEGTATHPAEFYDDFDDLPDISSGLPTGYEVEDRLFITRDDMYMYALMDGATSGTYQYVQVSQVIDNVEIADYANKTNAIAGSVIITSLSEVTQADVLYYLQADDKFYKLIGGVATEYTVVYFPTTGSVDMIYVAKDEGITYIWDDKLSTPAYIPIGGADEVQVYATKSKFPTTGQGGKLYIALDEAQCYVYDGGYVLVSDRCTVLYENKAAFPATGVSGMIYIAKDTGKMYYYDTTSAAADKYVVLGNTDEVIVGTKAEIEALTLQEDVLYVASDEKKTYIALPNATTSVLELIAVGGGDFEVPTYTQTAWDALTDKPELAYISDSLFDALAYQNQ